MGDTLVQKKSPNWGDVTLFRGSANFPPNVLQKITKKITDELLQERRENTLRQCIQERKISPKSEFWGRISGGRPRGYPGGRPGAKTSVKPSKSWKNKHFGADVHDPKARTSMTRGGSKKLRSEKLRAEFSFPIYDSFCPVPSLPSTFQFHRFWGCINFVPRTQDAVRGGVPKIWIITRV